MGVLDINWTEIFTLPTWDRSYEEAVSSLLGKLWGVTALFLSLSPALKATCIYFVDYAACHRVLSHICGL